MSAAPGRVGGMARVGAIVLPSLPPEDLRAAVLAAEAGGVPELWIWEDCFRESAFAVAGAVLAWTERLRVGIGIAPMPLRNVAVTAMEIASLERMFPGRVLPGVGHGVQSWMGQVGARVASPLTLMREHVTALRALLAGDEVTTGGRYVSLEGVRLDWPPSSPPALYAAGEGPKTLRVTGETADGTVLVAGHPPQRLAEQIGIVRAARAAARPGEQDVVAYVIAAFGGADASERAGRELGRWNLPDEPSRVLVGTPEAVAAQASAFVDVGVDALILQPTEDEPDLPAFYAAAGEVAALIG